MENFYFFDDFALPVEGGVILPSIRHHSPLNVAMGYGC